ncbi:MAG TPA: DUF2652 domain-containing protein [Anaerolineales bacterium]|nr:DUF2652 domain-containing protein [Anaerolineales bacterium]
MKPAKSRYGYFLLADISGFSTYLVGAELEHASGILKQLLEGISRKIKPAFEVQGFDIDSVFALAPSSGSLNFKKLYGLVENTYSEFKNNLTEISNHITCNCAACRDVTLLDLKFMVHYGEYILSSVQRRSVLYGLDPAFVRNRNWKEAVSASVDWRGYFLLTEQCLASLQAPAEKFQGEMFDHDQFKMFGLELKSQDKQHEI